MSFGNVNNRFYFNSRSREGSDRSRTEQTAERKSISIHAPVKGATKRRNARFYSNNHFNSRSREGSDTKGSTFFIRGYNISIHAPVKGATYGAGKTLYVVRISIHAPVKGATSQRTD